MTRRASGTFEVKLTLQSGKEDTVGRMSIEKRFRGDLEASSKGEMLSVMSGVKGSAGYVAMELVSGMLHEQSGSFALQHSGTMNRGESRLNVTVVPDSGTGELVGLWGTMEIIVSGGTHSYVFEYTLGDEE
jgi:Protein of unknown function (DUF3224)